MATTKSMKIQAEIDKVKAKISEQQARLKELEQKKLEAENSEIVDIVRGMSISLTELPLLFEKLKDGGTLGQSVPKAGIAKPHKRTAEQSPAANIRKCFIFSFPPSFLLQPTPIRTAEMRNRLLWKKLRPRSQRLPLPRARAFRRMETL